LQLDTRLNSALRRSIIPAMCIALSALATGCQAVSYYGQAVWGQTRIMWSERPISAVMENPDTPRPTREKLAYVLGVREFARTELLLPLGGSYLAYAEIGRPFVAWNVFAAPELSLEPKTWCYPVAGCAAYRGYFSRDAAERCAADLRRQGYDVYVGGVQAYSTLGWFDDPVLSTFLGLGEARLSALLFHELAHRKLYAPGDTAFNEGFATAVEEEGLRRWAAHTRDPEMIAVYEQDRSLQERFIGLVERRRAELGTLYAGDWPADRKRAAKAEIFRSLRDDFEAAKRTAPDLARYEHWFATGLTNAGLSTIAAYHDLVPAFKNLLRDCNGDLAAFYAQCRAISELPPAERRGRLGRPAGAPQA
jgi:predicted aminopeptidase